MREAANLHWDDVVVFFILRTTLHIFELSKLFQSDFVFVYVTNQFNRSHAFYTYLMLSSRTLHSFSLTHSPH